MKRMGITPEDLESLSGEMMQAFGGAEEMNDLPDGDDALCQPPLDRVIRFNY